MQKFFPKKFFASKNRNQKTHQKNLTQKNEIKNFVAQADEDQTKSFSQARMKTIPSVPLTQTT